MKANFFIVGAPKCGTTAIYTYLQSHPAVFLPRTWKEPRYFCPDFWGEHAVKTPGGYEALFQKASCRHQVIGEATAEYVLSDVALPRIKDYNPSAKIVLMLRNPTELAEAWFDEMRYHWSEPLNDFESAWAAQEARRLSGPPRVGSESDPRLQYSRVCRVGSHLRKLQAVFAPEQVQVILMDDLKQDAKAVYQKLLQFLELPDDGRREFPKVYARREHRFPRLLRTLANPPEPLRTWKKQFRERMGLPAVGWGKWFVSLFDKPAPRRRLRPEFEEHLREHFAPEVELLEHLLARSLPDWKAIPTTGSSDCAADGRLHDISVGNGTPS